MTVNGNLDCDAGNVSLFASVGANTVTVGHATSTIVMAGNLQVDGTLQNRSATEIQIDDLTLQLAQGSADSATANGAGLKIDGADAELLYSHTGTKWISNKDIEAANFRGALVGNADTATQLETARNIGGVAFNASLDIVPRLMTVAAETVDTSCSVAFFNAATGDQQAKTGTNLTFNASSGALSATAFVGSGEFLTGLVSDSVVETVGTETEAYNLDETSETILLGNASSAAFAFTLPAASGKSGVMFKIKKIDASANAVKIKPQSAEFLEFVENATGEEATLSLETQGAAVSVFCDGTAWFVM
jgi:hypothetical protein